MTQVRKSFRLKGYDYSSDNLYFVTSCVHDRICCFGEIALTGRDPSIQKNGIVPVGTGRDLSQPQTNEYVIGGTGRDLSQSTDSPFSHNISPKMKLNEYGEIAKRQWHWLSEQYRYIVLHSFVVMPNHIHGIIEINHSRIPSPVSIKIKPLSEIMGAYKTTVSKQIHLAGFIDFKWQRSFYEHIIRDEKSFETITEYINYNPLNWKRDEFYNGT
jgi:putative transposase